jgi:hypothetical protein
MVIALRETRLAAPGEYEVSLDDDTFLNMKRNFDSYLNNMLSDMLAHGNSDGEISVNIKVELSKGYYDPNNNPYPTPIIKPTFKHKVTSTIKRKVDVDGVVGEGYELVLDPITERYVIRKIKPVQSDLFDAEVSNGEV